jgi:CTP synthase
MTPAEPDLSTWSSLVSAIHNPTREVTIGIVGKYVDLTDAYKSLNESLRHAGYAHHAKVNLKFVDSEELERTGAEAMLSDVDGVLVPGGFGRRGIEGKVLAVTYARTHKKPYFGICLGMQVAVIEYARNVAGLAGAHSQEFEPDAPHKVIDLMAHQRDLTDMGASMRLGAYPCHLQAGSLAEKAYGSADISERHRHRYEFATEYRDRLTEAGLILSGTSPDNALVEIVELADHPWFLGCQFHPEFKSRPTEPHPLFVAFIDATLRNSAQS